MRSGISLLVLAVSLVIASVARAEDHEADVENVRTPLTLAELLPEGGVDAVAVDFWMRTEASYKGRAIDVRLMRWKIEPVKGQLRVTYQSGTAGKRKAFRTASTTYTKDGKITAFSEQSYAGGRQVGETVGKVVDGELVITTSEINIAGHKVNVRVEKRSLDVLKTTVPSEWFPLVVAYHIRKGSLGYRFARTDLHYRFQHAETSVEDVGVEEVEHNGKKVAARMLLAERTFGKAKGRVDMKIQYLMLPNGEMLSSRTIYGGYRFLSKRVTREAIKKEFWLPGEDAGK